MKILPNEGYPMIGDHIRKESWYRFYIVERIVKCKNLLLCECESKMQLTFKNYPDARYCYNKNWVIRRRRKCNKNSLS